MTLVVLLFVEMSKVYRMQIGISFARLWENTVVEQYAMDILSGM